MHRTWVRTGPESIVYLRADGAEVTIAWRDLDAVLLQTADDGPLFTDDLYWILESRGTRYAVPSETHGVAELMHALQRLPGFDNDALIDASASLEAQTFLCWRRSP